MLNAQQSLELRDRGISQVTDNAAPWPEEVEEHLRWFLIGNWPETFTVESFREYATARGLREPHHRNAWGAVTKMKFWKDRCEPTGEYRKAATVSAHARAVMVWRRKK